VDKKVLLWDLNRENSPESVALTIGAHTDKVQALQWHPVEQHILLTGCCDGFVRSFGSGIRSVDFSLSLSYARVFDCKSGDSCKSWKVQGEVERVIWNHFNPYSFLVCFSLFQRTIMSFSTFRSLPAGLL
jgi:periodic tryptophan protein 1